MKRCLIVPISLSVLLFSLPASAGFFDSINKGVRTLKRTTDFVQDQEDRRLQRQIRREREEERRRELEEYRQARLAATEAQRAEADRRRAVFESLSEEEKTAYIERQQELKKQQNDRAAALMLLFFGAALSGGPSSGGTAQGGSSCGAHLTPDECELKIQRQQDRQFRPSRY